VGDDGRQTEETGPQGWLPPLAPGAQAPRRWHTVPEPSTPAGRSPPSAPEAALGPNASSAAPTASGPDDAWWRDQRGASGAAPATFGGPLAAPVATNGHAVAALTLGIAGLVLFFASGFGLVFVLNLPCSVLAWVFGLRGMRRVDRGETAQRRGMAQAGMVLGVVGTVAGGLAIIGWTLGFLLSDELRDELQREWDRQRKR
jgi:hypothetical protein